MKVLHLTNNYPTHKYPISGIFVKEQIESLTKIGIINSIFHINGRENGKFEYISSIFRLRKYLQNQIFDVIHCHHALSAWTLLLSGHFKKNVIVSFQNDPKYELGYFLYYMLVLFYKYKIFKSNSSLIKSQCDHYLPNGVNLDFFKPVSKREACQILQIDSKKKYILFVSSNFIRKQKRIDRFNKVINLIKKDPKYASVEGLYLVNESRNKIPYYFNAASVHLLLSDFEGSPNSVKEAMSCNIPVIATNVGNIVELLDGLDNSYIFNEYSACNIVERVKEIIQNRKSNGRERLVQLQLDQKNIAMKLEQIYRSITIDTKYAK